jgi:50S ribosomal subunit-associated GTPase HflX
MYVFNKIDEVSEDRLIELREGFAELNPLFISAYKNIGIPELKQTIIDNL